MVESPKKAINCLLVFVECLLLTLSEAPKMKPGWRSFISLAGVTTERRSSRRRRRRRRLNGAFNRTQHTRLTTTQLALLVLVV